MSTWNLPWDASCLCARVKMRVSAAPLIAMACHCTGCQKLTSSAYSMTLMIPGDGFAVLEGETVLGALQREQSQHHYCAFCKSWLYTTSPMLGGLVNFRPTMLADARWVVPYIESWVSEKLPGVVTGAKHSFAQFPAREQYPDLMAGFAREGARPA